ncbi:MAG TPA: hypothetical protein ENN03_10280 [bacterium]|nr:hypothetical protein [bacterium]
MKKIIPLFFLAAGLVFHCGRRTHNRHYPVNPKPLVQTRFVRLPLGTIEPEGWLKRQLEIQAEGLTGHIDEFWPDLMHSAWKGGGGEAWERGPYYLDGLIALAYLLQDTRLIMKVQSWIDPIIKSRNLDGWFGPTQNKDRWPLAVALKALAQYHEATGDGEALRVIQNYFQYLNENPPDWPDDTWRGVRAMEHAVTGYWLYRRTGNPLVLETLDSIFNHSFDWTGYFETFPWDSAAVAEKRVPHNWKADGLTAHVVNNAMAVKYPGLWFQQSGDSRYRKAVYTALNRLDGHHGQLGGRFSGDEHLSGKRPTQGTEFCAVVEYLFSLENLLEIFGDPVLADRIEFLAYNALPGTMTPDGWAHQYDQQTNQVLVTEAPRDWSTNGDASNIYGLMPNYPCCLANMHQAWPKLVQSMWMATHDQGLAAMIYGPSEVTANVQNGFPVHLRQETDYPFNGPIRIIVDCLQPVRFPVYLRIPGWSRKATATVGGKKIRGKPGTMMRIDRKWQDGDVIVLDLDMSIRTERRFLESISIWRGPLAFALRIGKRFEKITFRGDRFYSIPYKGSSDWEIHPTTDWNIGLLLDPRDPESGIEVISRSVSEYPFADREDLIWDEKTRKHRVWTRDAPVTLKVQGRILENWSWHNNSAADPPRSPVVSDRPLQPYVLIPYGCTRLRIGEFPVLKR